MDEAELAHRRERMRRFKRYRDKSDAQLNAMILRRASGITGKSDEDVPADPELLLPETLRELFRSQVQEITDRIKDDVDTIALRPMIENHVLIVLRLRVALHEGATTKEIKELDDAARNTAEALGLTRRERRLGGKKSDETVADALAASYAHMEEHRQGRRERRQEVEEVLKAKQQSAPEPPTDPVDAPA